MREEERRRKKKDEERKRKRKKGKTRRPKQVPVHNRTHRNFLFFACVETPHSDNLAMFHFIPVVRMWREHHRMSESHAPKRAMGSQSPVGGGPSHILCPLPLPPLLSPIPRRVSPEDFQWVFRKDGKASRVIATLEALAMLLAVRAFFPKVQGTQSTRLVVLPSYTDNRGNGALLNKLMSSRYPLSALLMEFGEQTLRGPSRCEVDTERGEPRSRPSGKRRHDGIQSFTPSSCSSAEWGPVHPRRGPCTGSGSRGREEVPR